MTFSFVTSAKQTCSVIVLKFSSGTSLVDGSYSAACVLVCKQLLSDACLMKATLKRYNWLLCSMRMIYRKNLANSQMSMTSLLLTRFPLRVLISPSAAPLENIGLRTHKQTWPTPLLKCNCSYCSYWSKKERPNRPTPENKPHQGNNMKSVHEISHLPRKSRTNHQRDQNFCPYTVQYPLPFLFFTPRLHLTQGRIAFHYLWYYLRSSDPPAKMVTILLFFNFKVPCTITWGVINISRSTWRKHGKEKQ